MTPIHTQRRYDGPRFSRIQLEIRAVHCRNRCRHCYASVGGDSLAGRLSATDILDTVKAFSRLCTQKKGVSLCLNDDPFDHPEIEQVIQGLWEDGFRTCTRSWATHGAGILHWDDPLAGLRQLHQYGIETFQFAFHGDEQEHDWFVRREGAFQDTLRAAELCLAAGLGVYWAVFINTRNLRQIRQLVDRLDTASGASNAKLFLSTWTHAGSATDAEELRPTLSQYETLRPELGDRLPEGRTEAYWVAQALQAGVVEFPKRPLSFASFSISETGVVRHALSDGSAEIGSTAQPLEAIVARYLQTQSTLRTVLAKRDSAALRRLAGEHGDPRSQKVHTWLSALRCWIARQRART